MPDNLSEGIPGVEGGMVEMIGVSRLNKNLSDAEVLKAMPAPEVMKTFQDMAQNLTEKLK